ncbi:MAG: GTPase HflX [Limimaricola sp.]|uniref:GTPase HflX n=1 Tax=Limimaricola sp. TaxID=2211665 RepID=UPI001D9B7AA6|nr:GTPase HflX [Limimaricola sp.]MBI1418108.1 GTPase HflX [Limimaricola sp.]
MDHDRPATRAWVLHPDIKTDRHRRESVAALEEAVGLAAALPGLEVVGAGQVRLSSVHPGMLFGKGKIAELKQKFADEKVELVLVDGPVGPVQQRNLEKEWGVKLLDRTGLILEIFSDRARTNEGVLQVEMAALSYQRTRLVRAWTHLERQRGGLGFVGGPGETQIEADRRAIDEQLIKLKEKLDKVVRTRALHRAARAKVPYPIVALVGYTNAGKSTLFNRLTGAEVLVKDMLFATLDPTMRRVVLPAGDEVILSDTVGFISDLPTELVAAFRATLEEVLDADLIVHVRDISHPQSEAQARDVMEILHGLGVSETAPLIEVWNKIDLLEGEARAAVERQSDRTKGLFAVSAIEGQGIDALLDAIAEAVRAPQTTEVLDLPFAAGRARAWLHNEGVVDAEEQTDTGSRLTVTWTAIQKARFANLQT